MVLKFDDPDSNFAAVARKVAQAYVIPSNLPKDSICLDIGCNVGAFSVLNAGKFGKIVGYEAASETYRRSLKNLKEQGIENVEVFNLAAGSTSGETLRLRRYENFSGKYGSGDASVIDFIDPRNNHGYQDDAEFEEVESISLEDMIKAAKVDRINYLKCDIEGGEYDFLMGKDLSVIDYLAIEMHVQLGKKKRQELLEYIEDSFIRTSGNTSGGHWELCFRNMETE